LAFIEASFLVFDGFNYLGMWNDIDYRTVDDANLDTARGHDDSMWTNFSHYGLSVEHPNANGGAVPNVLDGSFGWLWKSHYRLSIPLPTALFTHRIRNTPNRYTDDTNIATEMASFILFSPFEI